VSYPIPRRSIGHRGTDTGSKIEGQKKGTPRGSVGEGAVKKKSGGGKTGILQGQGKWVHPRGQNQAAGGIKKSATRRKGSGPDIREGLDQKKQGQKKPVLSSKELPG